MNEITSQQRKLNDQNNNTGYKRTDSYHKRVASANLAIMFLSVIAPVIISGIKALFGTFKSNN